MDNPDKRTTDVHPGKDTEFLDHLLSLAQRAEGVVAEAEERCAVLSSEGETKSGLEGLVKGELTAQCGEVEKRDTEHVKVERYWQSVRVVASVQFSGSSKRFENAWTLFCKNRLKPWKSVPKGYWTWPKKDPPYPYCRARTLLTLFEALLIRPVPDAKITEGVTTVTEIGKILEFLTKNLAPAMASTSYDTTGLVRAIKSVRRLHKQATQWKAYTETADFEGKFVRLQDALAGVGTDHGLDSRLHDRLTLYLHQPNSDAPHFQIADIASTLAGRYLNPSLQMRPSRYKLYTQSVRHVLEGRQPGSGSWQFGLGDERAESEPSPFVNPASTFAPLSFLLDLPNSVLVPSIRLLATAIDEALSTLSRRLSSERPEDDLNHTLYDGLMVGTAAAERLRDLVSHLLLQELRAAVPVQPVKWHKLSDSLGFLESLKLGVIKKWEERSKERPGAVLIFGPPGTGKTTFAASLVAVLNGDDTAELKQALRSPEERLDEAEARAYESRGEKWHFLSLSPADFARRGADKIIASAEEMFQKLRRLRRCVVLLDEMEEFLRVRGPSSTRESRLVTTAFLPLLQDTVDAREIILLVATNFVGTIDAAISRRGRFDLILPMGPPDRVSRLSIIRVWQNESEKLQLHARDLKESARIISQDLEKFEDPQEAAEASAIVKYTQGYIWAEIRDFMNELVESHELLNGKKDELEFELWKIRQEKVPMALSGGPGCDWRAFHDEALRLSRKPNTAPSTASFQDYWDAPALPVDPKAGSAKK